MRGRIPIGLDFEINKLTRSIENLSTGDSFATAISPITSKDLLGINKKNEWLFKWKNEFCQKQKKILN